MINQNPLTTTQGDFQYNHHCIKRTENEDVSQGRIPGDTELMAGHSHVTTHRHGPHNYAFYSLGESENISLIVLLYSLCTGENHDEASQGPLINILPFKSLATSPSRLYIRDQENVCIKGIYVPATSRCLFWRGGGGSPPPSSRLPSPPP